VTTEIAPRFVDTSVVARYLTGDPPPMAEEAARILDGEMRLAITGVVIVEAAYVLTSVYKVPREVVVDAIVRLVRKENLAVFGMVKDFVILGLLMCRPSDRVSIGDALIWAAARSAGATQIFTFDQRFPSADVKLRHFARQ
jgi:predicted nucleic acid-binding protein